MASMMHICFWTERTHSTILINGWISWNLSRTCLGHILIQIQGKSIDYILLTRKLSLKSSYIIFYHNTSFHYWKKYKCIRYHSELNIAWNVINGHKNNVTKSKINIHDLHANRFWGEMWPGHVMRFTQIKCLNKKLYLFCICTPSVCVSQQVQTFLKGHWGTYFIHFCLCATYSLSNIQKWQRQDLCELNMSQDISNIQKHVQFNRPIKLYSHVNLDKLKFRKQMKGC